MKTFSPEPAAAPTIDSSCDKSAGRTVFPPAHELLTPTKRRPSQPVVVVSPFCPEKLALETSQTPGAAMNSWYFGAPNSSWSWLPGTAR
jgi:hypothetical protein